MKLHQCSKNHCATNDRLKYSLAIGLAHWEKDEVLVQEDPYLLPLAKTL